MISKSKASVFLEDTLNITGLQRPELIPIAAHLVKSKQAKKGNRIAKKKGKSPN